MFWSSVFFPSYDIVFNPCFLFLIFLICSYFHCFYSPLFASSSADMPNRQTVGFSGRLGESRLIADSKATMVRYPARYIRKERRGARSCLLIYFYLATHVSTASSTALDRSPFLPPNLSIVLNLSFFSRSSDSSTLIRPISTTNFFRHDSHVLDVFPISKFPDATCCFCPCYHFPSTCHLLIHITYYMLTDL